MGHPPIFGGASFLSRSFIGIPRKPSYSASFSPLIFLLHDFFLISLYILIKQLIPRTLAPSPLRITLDPLELDPGTYGL